MLLTAPNQRRCWARGRELSLFLKAIVNTMYKYIEIIDNELKRSIDVVIALLPTLPTLLYEKGKPRNYDKAEKSLKVT